MINSSLSVSLSLRRQTENFRPKLLQNLKTSCLQILLSNSPGIFPPTRCRELLGNKACIFYSYPWTVSSASGEQALCFTYNIPGTGPGTGHSTNAQCLLNILSAHNELCTVQKGRVGRWMIG